MERSNAYSGIQGVINAVVGVGKTVDGLLLEAPTVGLSTYLGVGGLGQALTGAGQLIYAVSGDSSKSASVIQNGSILSGPISGATVYAVTRNPGYVAQAGSLEGAAFAGPLAIDKAVSWTGAVLGFCPP